MQSVHFSRLLDKSDPCRSCFDRPEYLLLQLYLLPITLKTSNVHGIAIGTHYAQQI